MINDYDITKSFRPVSPLVDTCTMLGIESYFKGSTKDPWRDQLVGKFADIYIYSDNFRYTLPLPKTKSIDISEAPKPSIIGDLSKRESNVAKPLIYSTDERRLLKNEYLNDCFHSFVQWARNNNKFLKQWILANKVMWIRDLNDAQFAHGFVFSLEEIRKNAKLGKIALELGVTLDDVLYAFDTVLRYPMYGEYAGSEEYYLHHPIRNAFHITTKHDADGAPPFIPLSFEKSISSFAGKLTQEEYSVLLFELRRLVREKEIINLKPGEFEKKVVREIASAVELPPTIRGLGKGALIAGGTLSVLGAVPLFGPTAAIVGGAVSVSASIWSGKVPRKVSKYKWLRWLLKWDIEEQVKNK